jgi:SAM-dependent methyltransferase
MPVLEQINPSAFDAVAQNYDEFFTDSAIGQAQRRAVWQELENAFRPGDSVLEIGCGTGVDACFLAERGVSVLACDSSSVMLEVASTRVRDRQSHFKHASVGLHICPAEEIGRLDPGRLFDGAFSNFGVLNCVRDLGQFARQLAAHLRPHAPVMLCLMGPCCLWEVAWFLAHGQPGRATRRFRRKGIVARVGETGLIQIYYPGVRRLARAFAPQFRLRSFKGIGLTVPPTYARPWTDRFPASLKFAASADRLLANCPGIRTLADHILVTFERVQR